MIEAALVYVIRSSILFLTALYTHIHSTVFDLT